MNSTKKGHASAAQQSPTAPQQAPPEPDDCEVLEIVSTASATPEPPSAPAKESAAPEIQAGTLIGRYVVLSRLGEGGMGVVYAAFDPKLERRLAIKLLHQQGAQDGSEGRARMLREAQVLAQLAHPNVVSIFDVGIHSGQVFIGMEFLDGGTLAAWCAQRPRSVGEILELYTQAGRGLGAAHAANFIHRDFKPDNVLLGKDGRARVTDFGVARLADQDVAPARPNLEALNIELPASGLNSKLTTGGALIGTPLYMAPEQFNDRPTDARTDQFSFCVALYESLYGETPFAGNTIPSLYANITAGRIRPPPSQSRVPSWLRAILVRGLSTAPEARYASMDELLLALASDPRAKWQRRRNIAGAAALILLLGILLVYVANRPRHDPCLAVRQQAESSLKGVWDAGQKERIGRALPTDQGKPGTVWQKLTSNLDEYTRQWVDMQYAACGERIRTTQSQRPALRKLCLGLLYSELTALTPTLAKPTPQSVGNALAAVWSLPPLRRCDDDHTLDALVPLLNDPKERQSVEDLTQKLEAVRVTEPGTDYRAVLAEAASIEARARSIKFKPLWADSLLVLGGLQQQVSDRPGATKSLTQAALDGLASGQLPIAAEAFARLVSLMAIEKKFELADNYAQLAGATLTMLGKNELSLARLLHAQGDLAVARFQFDEALKLHEQALELRKSLDSSHPDLAESHGKRAFVLRRLHRNDQALKELEETLAIYRMFFDDSHPRVAQTLRYKASVLADSGRFPEALAVLHDILKMQVAQAAAARPPRSPQQPDPDQETTLRELVRVHLMMGKYRKASDYAEQALSKAVPGKEAASAILKARALLCLGELTEAQAAAEQAQQSSRKLLGSQSPDYADATYWLGSVLLQQGDIEGALKLQEEALAIREKLSDPMDHAASLIAVAILLTRTRHAAQGVERIEEASHLLQSSAGPSAEFSYVRRHLAAEAKAAKAAALFELSHHHVTPEILSLREAAALTYADPRIPDSWSAQHLVSQPKKHSRHRHSAG